MAKTVPATLLGVLGSSWYDGSLAKSCTFQLLADRGALLITVSQFVSHTHIHIYVYICIPL